MWSNTEHPDNTGYADLTTDIAFAAVIGVILFSMSLILWMFA
jgi:hypothetical protein